MVICRPHCCFSFAIICWFRNQVAPVDEHTPEDCVWQKHLFQMLGTMPGVPTANLESWMAPLPPPCLGRFCSGYHIADAPSRVACVRSLLEISGFVLRQVVTESNVSKALGSIFQHAPHLISRAKEPLATAQPLPLPGSDKIAALAQYAVPVVANVGSPTCPCGRKLVRWKRLPAVLMTLATGKLHGHVLVLRCFHCKAAHAGAWCWKDVGESSSSQMGFIIRFAFLPGGLLLDGSLLLHRLCGKVLCWLTCCIAVHVVG